eukprot:m.55149 g.55149  ORF g.55149 m.55149 type:complete len:206 (+) comp34452_c0_seq12:1553-2170(+)
METDLSSSQSNNRRQLRRSLSTFDCIRDAVTILYRIDDFDLEPLGSGFFSDVYKVRHRSSGQVLVLKLGKSTSSRAQILQEVELMKRLSHPNILRFHGVCVRDGQLHPLSEVRGVVFDVCLVSGWAIADCCRMGRSVFVGRRGGGRARAGNTSTPTPISSPFCRQKGLHFSHCVSQRGSSTGMMTGARKRLSFSSSTAEVWMNSC